MTSIRLVALGVAFAVASGVTLAAQTVSTPAGASSQASTAQTAPASPQGAQGAQNVEPQEPGIVLPPVVTKIEDVAQATITAPLPEEAAPALPDLNVALPEPQSLSLGGAALEVLPPGEAPGGAGVSPSTAPQSTFFSDGMIGAGSMNQVIGDITLYKLGDEPRFSIEFSHERLDGYEGSDAFPPFYQAGAGYFNRKDSLVGSLAISPVSWLKLETDDSYRETEDGLQQLGGDAYSSVLHRFLSGGLTGSYTSTSPFSGTLETDVHYGDATLVGPSPQASGELSVQPKLDLLLTYPHLTLGLHGVYDFMHEYADTDAFINDAQGTADLHADLPLSIGLTLSGGLYWQQSQDLVFPFSARIDGALGSNVTLYAEGGFRAQPNAYFDVWQSYPFLAADGPLLATTGWHAGGGVTWHVVPSFSLDGSLDYDRDSNTIVPGAGVANGLFSFTQSSTTTLSPSVGLVWDPSGPFLGKLVWHGSFLDPGAFNPYSTLTFDAELNDASDTYGGSISGDWDLYREAALVPQEVPNVKLSGYLRVSHGVLFQLEVDDIFSTLIDGGRKLWDTYTLPGFRVVLSTRISL